MKIGFIAPQSISVINGGVRTQALMTAQSLEDLGVEVVFISPWDDISSTEFDLFHVFTAGYETIGIVSRLRELHKKIALSPVMFSNRGFKTIQRALTIEEKLSSLSKGIRSEFGIKKEVCNLADRILPNTSDEAELISTAFEIDTSKINVVPNGVELRFLSSKPELFIKKTGLNNFVLFAGQASAPRKNVLSLINAVQELDVNLVIIGDFDNTGYSKVCIEHASKNKNVHLFDSLGHDSELLSSAYAACKVFALPSQFETPGIAAMEAALAGANIVITQDGGTKDYFNESAEYVAHNSVESIKEGIIKALEKPKAKELSKHISENYSWDKVGKLTLSNYQEILA